MKLARVRAGFRRQSDCASMRGRRADRTPAGLPPRPPSATGCLTNSASLPYAGRDLHPHAPSGAQVPGTCASAFRHQRLEWPARFELALRPWQGRVLPLTLRPQGASGEIRTHDLRLTEAALHWSYRGDVPGAGPEPCVRRFQGPAGMPSNPPRNGAATRCRPGPPALQGQGHSRVRRQGTGASHGGRFRFTDQRGLRAYAGAGCPRRESDPHCQRPWRCASYQIGLRGRGAATRCRPGSSAVRRRSRSRARRRGLGNQDSNLN